MQKVLLGVAGLSLAGLAVPATAATVYSNDFETGSTTGITGVTNIETAPGGQKFLGTLSVGSASTLTVATGGFTNLVLSFDPYALNSLDGDGTSFCCGPDNFKLVGNGSTLLENTFTNVTGWTQNYGGAGSPGGTGSDAALTGTLGYSFFGPDHTYHLSFNLGSNASTILDFFGNTDQAWNDEGFGVDNIVLTGTAVAAPEASAWALMILGLGLSGAAMRRKQRQVVRHSFA